jgi:hypothetical protein
MTFRTQSAFCSYGIDINAMLRHAMLRHATLCYAMLRPIFNTRLPRFNPNFEEFMPKFEFFRTNDCHKMDAMDRNNRVLDGTDLFWDCAKIWKLYFFTHLSNLLCHIQSVQIATSNLLHQMDNMLEFSEHHVSSEWTDFLSPKQHRLRGFLWQLHPGRSNGPTSKCRLWAEALQV